MNEILIITAGGMVGALIKEILDDNCVQLPSVAQGKLNLGFFGSIIIGAFVGYAIDGGFVTAAMAGYTGFSVIEKLVPNWSKNILSGTGTIEDTIRQVCKDESVDPELAVKVAKCESNLNPQALNVNTDGSRDRGIFQINEKYHPEVTDTQAFDVEFSTRFFCKAFKNGNISWWNASKKCWG